jgi:CheY-like chemotaxis protein
MRADLKSGVSGTERGTILLVEDNPDDAFMVTRALQQAGASQPVFHVQNGEEAVDYLSGKPPYDDRAKYPLPALVLLDLKMPRLSGFEVLTWLQTRAELSDIPVVVLTGSVRSEDRKEAEKRGAVGYQVKPVAFSDLVEIVRQVDARWLGGSEPENR